MYCSCSYKMSNSYCKMHKVYLHTHTMTSSDLVAPFCEEHAACRHSENTASEREWPLITY